MTARERVLSALKHRQPDRVPHDLGGTVLTGMHVSTVYRLRQALGLDSPGTPVRVIEPFQMLGEIGDDLRDRLGSDTVPLLSKGTLFGYPLEGWKPWRLHDGTPVLVPSDFNTQPEANGDILMYPGGDRSAAASGRMPAGGYYFDAVVRQLPLDATSLDPRDNTEEFVPVGGQELGWLRAQSERLFWDSDRAPVLGVCYTSFGDIALVPGLQVRNPRGIRDVEEWYVSMVARPGYIAQVFERQCEVGLANLKKVHEAIGDRVVAALITGADFGGQSAPIFSRRTYRDLFFPFHRRVNEWVHRHTSWRTFIHSCGAILELLPDLIEAGFDILNPVQTSAAGMDPRELKRRFGERVVFWGGGVDTQRTLPFGSPEQVRAEVRERLQVFGKGGGFVFAAVHNIQANTPVENLLAMYDTLKEGA